MIYSIILYFALLPFLQCETINIGVIYGSLGYSNPVFPDWETALFYGSQLIPASESIPGYNIFDYPTRAIVLSSDLINKAGGIPLHDINDTRLSVNTTFFNINFYSPGAENTLIADLTNPNGPYGYFKFFVSVFGTSPLWASACEILGNCVVISVQVPNGADYICTEPLPQDCITNHIRVGARRFHNLFTPFYAFDTMNSPLVDLWHNLGIRNVAILCSPLVSDQIICNELISLVRDDDMNVVYYYDMNFTRTSAWSVSEASVIVSNMIDAKTEGVFMIAVANSGIPIWLRDHLSNFIEAMKILDWTPLQMECQTLATANIDIEYSQYTIIADPFLDYVKGTNFRAINNSNNLEIFPANSMADSPAVFVSEYNKYFPKIPEIYTPPAAIAALGMVIIFKCIEFAGSSEISDFITQTYIIRTPSHYGLLAFDEVGRLVAESKDLIFGQYINVDGTPIVYPLTPLSIGQKPIYPIPTWKERNFDPTLRYTTTEHVFIVLSIISIIYCAFYIWVVLRFKNHPVIKGASPNFLILFLIGSILLLCSNFVNTLTQNNTTCSAQVWCLTLGFTIMYGAIFIRILRILYIFKSNKLTGRIVFTDQKLLMLLILLIFIDVLINLIWNFQNGMNVTYISVDIYRPYYDYNTCVSDAVSVTYAHISLAYKFILIISGVICTFLGRNVPAQFNETTSIFSAIYCAVIICSLGVPFVVTGVGGRTATVVIQSAGILLLVLSAVSFIFIPKLYYVKVEDVSIYTETKKNTYTHSLGSTLSHTKEKNLILSADNKIAPVTSDK